MMRIIRKRDRSIHRYHHQSPSSPSASGRPRCSPGQPASPPRDKEEQEGLFESGAEKLVLFPSFCCAETLGSPWDFFGGTFLSLSGTRMTGSSADWYRFWNKGSKVRVRFKLRYWNVCARQMDRQRGELWPKKGTRHRFRSFGDAIMALKRHKQHMTSKSFRVA